MKIFAFIFSFYIAWLTIQPCADHIFSRAQNVNTEITSQGTTEDSHSNDETCSPLCSCSCCNAQFIITTNQLAVLLIGFAEKNLPVIPLRKAKEICFTFWQPPRIG